MTRFVFYIALVGVVLGGVSITTVILLAADDISCRVWPIGQTLQEMRHKYALV